MQIFIMFSLISQRKDIGIGLVPVKQQAIAWTDVGQYPWCCWCCMASMGQNYLMLKENSKFAYTYMYVYVSLYMNMYIHSAVI